MRFNKLSGPDWLLAGANLLPAYGVWALGWPAWQAFAVYSFETIIAGAFSLIKVGVASVVQSKTEWPDQKEKRLMAPYFFLLFFILHWSVFVAVQMNLFAGALAMRSQPPLPVLSFITHPFRYLPPGAGLMVATFITAYAGRLLTHFFLNGRYKTITIPQVMFEPYRHSFIQQLVVITGACFLLTNTSNVLFLLFALLKIVCLLYNRPIWLPSNQNRHLV